MARNETILTQQPTDIPDALDMSAAMAGKGDDKWDDDDEYKGEEYPSASDLVDNIRSRHRALKELGQTLLSQLPANLPQAHADARTQEELQLIILREQINRTMIGLRDDGDPNTDDRPDIDLIVDGSPDRDTDEVEDIRDRVIAQFNEIKKLKDNDENQAVDVSLTYLNDQRVQYERLLNKYDQLEAIRSSFTDAMINNRPVSQASWEHIWDVQTPASSMRDIKQKAGFNEFYANLEQHSVAVSFKEMEAQQQNLRNRATTLASNGSPDQAREMRARADALQTIIDRKADVLALISSSVDSGIAKKNIILGMSESEKDAAGDLLRAQGRDFAIINHVSGRLRSIYSSTTPATREDLFKLLSGTGTPETTNQAKTKAKWQVMFTQDGHNKASTLFTEMEAKKAQYLADANALTGTAADEARRKAEGLQTILNRKDDILNVLQANTDTATQRKTEIDRLTEERHLPQALTLLGQQETSLATTDRILTDIRTLIDSDTPATHLDSVRLLVGNSGIQTVAQAKVLSEWNSESLNAQKTQIDQAYNQLQSIKTRLDTLAVDYSRPGMEANLQEIKDRTAEVQALLNDKDATTTKVSDSVRIMGEREASITGLPSDGSQMDLASRLLTQQRDEMNATGLRLALLQNYINGYTTALGAAGSLQNTNLTAGVATLTLPSSLTVTPGQVVAPPATNPNANTSGSGGSGGSNPASPAIDPVTGLPISTGTNNTQGGTGTRTRTGGQTSEQETLTALKADANILVTFIPGGEGGQATLSGGDKVNFGTQAMLNLASNTYTQLDKAYKEAEELEKKLRASGRRDEADSVERDLATLNQNLETVFQAGGKIKDLNEDAKKLQQEILASTDINLIQGKLDQLYTLNQQIYNIGKNEYDPAVEAFRNTMKNNRVLDEQINSNMTIGGFVRTWGGELGRRAVGSESGVPGFLGDAWNTVAGSGKGIVNWWTKDVKNSITSRFGENMYMGANFLLTLVGAGMAKSLWNNTVGKWTGMQVSGFWSVLLMGGAALFALNQSNDTAKDFEANKGMRSGFNPDRATTAFERRGNTSSFGSTGATTGSVSQTGANVGRDPATLGTFTVYDQQTGNTVESVTVPASNGPASSVDQSGNMQFAPTGRTTSQGRDNSPASATSAETVVNADSNAPLASTEMLVAANAMQAGMNAGAGR